MQPTPEQGAERPEADSPDDPNGGPLLTTRHDPEHKTVQKPEIKWLKDPAVAFMRGSLNKRLIGTRATWADTPASLRLWFWLAPALTALIGGLLRFVRLGQPEKLVFDETYYVKDAYSYLQSGYERNWAEKANDLFNQGIFTGIADTPEYVVHPPVGKCIVAC